MPSVVGGMRNSAVQASVGNTVLALDALKKSKSHKGRLGPHNIGGRKSEQQGIEIPCKTRASQKWKIMRKREMEIYLGRPPGLFRRECCYPAEKMVLEFSGSRIQISWRSFGPYASRLQQHGARVRPHVRTPARAAPASTDSKTCTMKGIEKEE